MAIRHTAVKGTLDVGTHEEWNDDHLYDFEDEVDILTAFVTPQIGAFWDLGQTAGGNNPVLVFENHHAFCKLDTGAVTGQISSIRYEFNGAAGNITYINDAPAVATAVGLTSFHTSDEVAEFGFFESGTSPFTANQDGAYFRVKDNKLYAVTGDGAAETATDVTPEGGVSAWGHYRIELNPTNCKFYVNGRDAASATHTTNLPDSDLTIKFSVQSQNNITTTMYIDGVGLERNRYKG